MQPTKRSRAADSASQILRLDPGHRADATAGQGAARRIEPPRSGRQPLRAAFESAGSHDRSTRLRVCAGTDARDPTPRGGWMLQRFRENFSTLVQLARDPLVCYAEEGAVLSELRETLYLTESALRQFETQAERDGVAVHAHSILAIANVVEQRVDDLFDRMERLTELRQLFFRFSAMLESISRGQVPRVHELEQLATWIIDAACDDDAGVTLLDPDAAQPALRIAAHAVNVAQVAVRMALAVPAWADELALVVESALLQDLGMMQVPAEILNSTELLTPTQRTLIQQHPAASAALVAQIPGHDDRLVTAVAQHHERLNGSGYPCHLSGLAVGPVARLLGVADSYVGIQSPRPYRPALSVQQAIVEMDRASFDGRLDPAWTCRLARLAPQWLKIPIQTEPPSGAPAVSALAA